MTASGPSCAWVATSACAMDVPSAATIAVRSSVPPRSTASAQSLIGRPRLGRRGPPTAAARGATRSARPATGAPKASEPRTTVSAPAARRRGTVVSRMPPSAASTTRPRARPRAGAPAPGQARAGLVREALAFDADGGAEQRHEGDAAPGRTRRPRPASRAAAPRRQRRPSEAISVQRLGRLRVLGVDRDEVGAGLGELLDLRQQDRVGHHQVDMDRPLGQRAQDAPPGRGRTGRPARSGRRRRRCGRCRRRARSRGRRRPRGARGRPTTARTRRAAGPSGRSCQALGRS